MNYIYFIKCVECFNANSINYTAMSNLKSVNFLLNLPSKNYCQALSHYMFSQVLSQNYKKQLYA